MCGLRLIWVLPRKTPFAAFESTSHHHSLPSFLPACLTTSPQLKTSVACCAVECLIGQNSLNEDRIHSPTHSATHTHTRTRLWMTGTQQGLAKADELWKQTGAGVGAGEEEGERGGACVCETGSTLRMCCGGTCAARHEHQIAEEGRKEEGRKEGRKERRNQEWQ